MTSFPCTHVKLTVHAEVSATATSNNDRTKIDKDEFVFDRIILNVLKYAVEIIKLILAGTYITTKSNSFRLGYFPIYLGYGDCKFKFFLHCLLLINKSTTLVCESNHTYKSPYGFKTYAAIIQGT